MAVCNNTLWLAAAIFLMNLLPILAEIEVLNKDFLTDRLSQHFHRRKQILSVSSFSWNDCGKASDPGHVTKLSVSPDPLVLPGNVTVGFLAKLSTPLKTPIVMDVKIQKKVLVWITIPCIDNFGSCTYSDACQLIPLLKCPPPFQKYGIPCKCPIPAKTYNLPPSVFYVDDRFLPSILTDGSYKVTAKVSQNKRDIGCLHLEFMIRSNGV